MKRARPSGLVLGLALGALALPTLAIWACRSPTQITLDIRTSGFKCSEIKRLAIVVAASAEKARDQLDNGFYAAEVIASQCQADDRVGTLVITPEESGGAVIVAASYDFQERCTPPAYKGCIIARRAFSFVDRSSLRLPVTLELVCKDVPCGVFTSCRAGQCVSSQAACEEGKADCVSEAEPVILADGGSLPSDASVQADGAPLPPNDGGPTDSGSDGSDGSDGSTGDGSTPVDSGTDAGDGGNTNPGATNLCPSIPNPTDCGPGANICCKFQTVYGCGLSTANPTCTNASYTYWPCTGRLHCPQGQFCCVRDVGAPPTQMRSECGTTCPLGIWCSVNADCNVGTCLMRAPMEAAGRCQ